MFVIDTNLLVYAANENFPGRGRILSLLAEWRESPEAWFTTWSVIYEFLRVVTHPSIFHHSLSFADAWRFVENLCESPSFGVLLETARHAEVVRDLTREYPHVSGNRMHDLHIAALMREHGVAEILTADADFHQFKFLRVVNPL
ncbi:MAG: PIN domain-containing protein [Acidobacteriota bacterium]|nr:PIN domain-containing protein [Acidobacteriota bacterium]